jgi:hypothetical protein
MLLLVAMVLLLGGGFFVIRWHQQIVTSQFELYLIGAAAAMLLAITVAGWLWPRLTEPALMLHAAALAGMLIVALAVAAFWAFPALIPDAIVAQKPALGGTQNKLVEHLDKRPWVKFTANTHIQTRLNRGPDFISEWQSDRYGFKNDAALEARRNYVAIALGDSFVEGMGSPIEETWPSLLSNMGYPTYNLGVQGFAPVQMLGTLEIWGEKLDAQFVLAGYTPFFESREYNYLDKSFQTEKRYTGGIGAHARMVEESRNAFLYTVFPVTNLFLDMARHAVGDMILALQRSKSGTDAAGEQFARYRDEVIRALENPFVAEDLGSKIALDRFREMQRICAARGDRFAVVYFAPRSLVYFEQVTGTPPALRPSQPAASRRHQTICRTDRHRFYRRLASNANLYERHLAAVPRRRVRRPNPT